MKSVSGRTQQHIIKGKCKINLSEYKRETAKTVRVPFFAEYCADYPKPYIRGKQDFHHIFVFRY